MAEKTAHHPCDVLIFGAGIAGLWLGNTLKRAGYNVIIIENGKIGGGQTLASQGMIHGGQKYVITGKVTDHASSLAQMPERWDACLGGWGEIDLTGTKTLSDTQVMWSAGSVLSDVAVFGAAKLVNADTTKLKPVDFPAPLQAKKKFKGPVYRLPEKVLDVRSLLLDLSKNLKGRILKGDIEELLPDGQAAVSGIALQAQLIIFTAGTGNEKALELLKVKQRHTQRRPLRQVMVRPMDDTLYGHGIVGAPKPRVTVTSHPDGAGAQVWYLGGNLAEQGADMTDDEAIAFAQKEMREIFPDIDWSDKEWATWQGDRAEPFEEKGQLPTGPYIHQRGRILISWATKLTFAPALSDHVFNWLKDKDIAPLVKNDPPPLPQADIGSYPWETATWRRMP